MNDSPKLKQAMDEIKKIIKFHDLGAVVVLHTPGHSEYLVKIDPTYSCARFEGNAVKIRARLDKDFYGDRAARDQTLADTSNMLHLLGDVSGMITLNLLEVSTMIDKHCSARHYPNDQSPDQTKNN